ncbi:MAG: SGNH/GDSL hydrolase family protein, partial [Hyphomicrobiales bacterium]|nr:SGNH/GDSL hydrolase family protein [Hyphomicrobiales bacterium]
FGPRAWIRPRLGAYYDRDGTLARELGVGFIDCRPAWKAMGAAELRQAIPDGLHPAPAAAARLLPPLIAEAIAGLGRDSRDG